MSTVIQPRSALISVSDKSGLVEFASRLQACGVAILSTGGTAQALRDAGIAVKDVSEHTGFPEIMAGRLKTLHPKIHGGILGRRGIDDEVMSTNEIEPIDLVVVNLYPFRETIDKPNATLEEAIENIDIGGPALLRAAAKNHASVGVVVNPADYPEVITAIERNAFDLEIRRRLMVKAFEHTADYDRAIANYFYPRFATQDVSIFPQHFHADYQLHSALRYGENPHQQAAFYTSRKLAGATLATAKQLQGKELSYNNIADADAALQTVIRFQEHPACVIVKHANPCGAALGDNILAAYHAAHRCDATSAFGGIIAFNRGLDGETAREIISRQFVEVLLAPAYDEESLQVLAQKPNVRVLEITSEGHLEQELQLTSVHGGLLVQEWDKGSLNQENLQIVSAREPYHTELLDMLFAWNIAKTVKSNAIVLAKNRATIGIGGGQTSRVYASQIAVMKAEGEGLDTQGSVLASDAFFPFRDGVDAAARAGVRAIIQPGGSIRDEEVIEAANEHGIAMIFTGMRHFRH
ncbi:MAG: bifunctional phosphoribosylaminoimidazolecarboxamide formyltransferase/IMP cyclohydrolase [Cardiobacteriaceae bacterium]|nr:bifunctional phosphoribosylaminoimidazolecarboxamide formyltransferase/IMP cyclohydrolase [Cardiobacteriaceae bacterium]